MARLRQQLATLLITSQLTGQLAEVGVPVGKIDGHGDDGDGDGE